MSFRRRRGQDFTPHALGKGTQCRAISDGHLKLSLYRNPNYYILQAMNKQLLKLIMNKGNPFQNMRKINDFRRAKYNFSMQVIKKHKIGVAIDIDGTILLKDKILPGAKQALEKLISLNIPYLLLTNNISRSELFKAGQINKIFNLSKPINEMQVILNYTPIKHKFQSFGDGVVLIIGRKSRLKQIVPLPFIKKYMTIDEYLTIFPQTAPLAERPPNEQATLLKEQIKKRLKLQTLNRHEFKIAGIIILTVPIHWQQCYQVVIDLLSTNNGTVSTERFFKYSQDHIPVMVGFNDLSHITADHNLPRLLMKPFTEGLKAVYRAVYHHQLRIQIYGKPQTAVFDFTKKQLQGLYGPIDKMVMIGDNEGSDIMGAYNSSWDSILVKTGVACHDSEFATVNADNILEGINQYLKQEQSL